MLTAENIESVHRELIALLSQSNTENKEVEQSLTKHLYAQLENYLESKNWEEADYQTYRLMLNIAKKEKVGYLDSDNINSFSCPDLQRIDQLWVTNSDKRFGFSVQKEIWLKTLNRLGIKIKDWTSESEDDKNYQKFAKAVGWYNAKETEKGEGWVNSYSELNERIKNNPSMRGSYPWWGVKYRLGVSYRYGTEWQPRTTILTPDYLIYLALRLVNCNI